MYRNPYPHWTNDDPAPGSWYCLGMVSALAICDAYLVTGPEISREPNHDVAFANNAVAAGIVFG